MRGRLRLSRDCRGNTDAHAKNTSVLHDQARVLRLAPAYDIVSTIALVNQRHFGISVAGKFVITEITRGDLAREARAWGVPERIARETIDRSLDAMQTVGVPAADEAYPNLREDVRTAAMEQVERVARS